MYGELPTPPEDPLELSAVMLHAQQRGLCACVEQDREKGALWGWGARGTLRFFLACFDLRTAFFSASSRRRRCRLVSGRPRSPSSEGDASPASTSLSTHGACGPASPRCMLACMH